MHGRKAAQYGVIFDMDMTCQLRIVGKNRVVTYLAIMRKMHIGHHPVVVAEPGNAGILHGAKIECAEFPNSIAIANFQSRRFSCILFVLRRCAERSKLENPVVAPDGGVPADNRMRADRSTGANFNMSSDYRVGADFNVCGKLRAGFNNRRWMNF